MIATCNQYIVLRILEMQGKSALHVLFELENGRHALVGADDYYILISSHKKQDYRS